MESFLKTGVEQMEMDLRTEEEVRKDIIEKRKKGLALDEREQKLVLEEIEEERKLRNKEYGR